MLKYPINYTPKCGVKCSMCHKPQYDTIVYQTGEYILCRECIKKYLEKFK
jgi:formylmethanofuran dehydrogenase subunit E